MPEELQSICEALAARLGRAVAIDDTRLEMLVHTAHDEQVDRHRIASVMQLRASDVASAYAFAHGIATADGPVRLPGSPEIGLLARVVVPIRAHDLLFGYLWLIDADHTVTDEEIGQAQEAADAAAEVLHRQRAVAEFRRGRARELLRDLLSADPARHPQAADELAADRELAPNTPVAVLAVGIVPTPDGSTDLTAPIDAAFRRVARRAGPLQLLGLAQVGGGAVLVAGRRAPTRPELHEVAESVRTALDAALGDGFTTHVGIGPWRPALAQARAGYTRARDALRLASILPDSPAVVDWADLGVYQVLAQLPPDVFPDEAVPEGLRRLIGTPGGGPLVETLEVYLDLACDARAAVERLHVHRTSLYYRLNRIEELTGMRLRSGTDRLALHLGLKVAHLTGLIG